MNRKRVTQRISPVGDIMLILSTSTELFFLRWIKFQIRVCRLPGMQNADGWLWFHFYKKNDAFARRLRKFYRCIQSIVNCHSLKIRKRPNTINRRQSDCSFEKISTAFINSGISGVHMQIIAASKIPNSFGIFHPTLCVRFSHRFIALWCLCHIYLRHRLRERSQTNTDFSQIKYGNRSTKIKFQMFELCVWIPEFVFLLFGKK